MLSNVGTIIKEWSVLLCTQRPIYARIDLISKKFLSIYHLSSIIPPCTSTRSGELAARAQKINIQNNEIEQLKQSKSQLKAEIDCLQNQLKNEEQVYEKVIIGCHKNDQGIY